MTQTAGPRAASPVADWRAVVDQDLAMLQGRAQQWAKLSLPQKIEMLEHVAERTGDEAQRWVELATKAKGLSMNDPLAGEEWTSGPWAVVYGVHRLVETLKNLARHGEVRLRAERGSERSGARQLLADDHRGHLVQRDAAVRLRHGRQMQSDRLQCHDVVWKGFTTRIHAAWNHKCWRKTRKN